MKAAIVPAVNRRWELKEIHTPEPGENQVLIQIATGGLCYTDVHQTRGELPGAFPRYGEGRTRKSAHGVGRKSSASRIP